MYPNPIPLHLRIGITGHRFHIDEQKVAEKIRTILDIKHPGAEPLFQNTCLHSVFPPAIVKKIHREPFPLKLQYTILSPLAEGADRVAAEVILESKAAELVCLIPSERQEYIKSFSNARSVHQFDAILQKAVTVSKVYKPSFSDHDDQSIFYNVGTEVVDQCDVLIAVWDGKPHIGSGGTAHIVKYAREQNKPGFIINTQNYELEPLMDGSQLASNWLMHYLEYNRALRNNSEQNALQNENKLLKTQNQIAFSKLSKQELEKINNSILPAYNAADKLSQLYKDKFQKTGLHILIFSASALFAVVSANHILPLLIEKNLALKIGYGVEFFLLIYIVWLIYIARSQNYRTSWIGYRILAEKLRIAYFLIMSGFSGMKTELKYTGISGNRQIRMCIDLFNGILKDTAVSQKTHYTTSELLAIKEFITKDLIDGQIQYHNGQCLYQQEKNERYERLGTQAFYLAVLVAFLHIVYCIAFPDHGRYHGLEILLTFLAFMIPTIASSIDGFRNQRSFSQNAHRSQNTLEQLHEIRDRMKQINNSEQLHAILKETERALLSEHRDWITQVSSSDLELKA